MKHLDLSDRIKIESSLNSNYSFREIARIINKDPASISREVRRNLLTLDKSHPYRNKNCCINRINCKIYGICEDKPNCTRKCSTCSKCNEHCSNFKEEKCSLLKSPPYVCNGCELKNKCTLKKSYYSAEKADKKYHETLSGNRQGFNMYMSEIKQVNDIVTPLLKQGQSIHSIYINNSDKLTVSESTIARLIKANMLKSTVFDQLRVVKLKPRKTNKASGKKVDKKCREGRTIEDYRKYMLEHPDAIEVECDTVIGKIGGKCLLTIIFPNTSLMLIFLCDNKTAFCIQSKFEFLYEGLKEDFKTLLEVILTDNGSEFSNPTAIEFDSDNKRRSNVFYCDPMASWQKPHVEQNHRLIRRILPKGTSFDDLTQNEVSLMMSHINSYKRPVLGNRSPFEMFSFLYGEDKLNTLLHLTCQKIISPNDVILKPSLVK